MRPTRVAAAAALIAGVSGACGQVLPSSGTFDGGGAGLDDEPEELPELPSFDASAPDAAPEASGPVASDAADAPIDACDLSKAVVWDASIDAGSVAPPDCTGLPVQVSAPVPIVVGPDGVLRGTVTGPRTHRWHGDLLAGNANCPPAATILDGHCLWSGAYTPALTNIPVVFDPVSRAGCVGPSRIGPYRVAPLTAPGTITWSLTSVLHEEKAWTANEALGVGVEDPATVAASKHFRALGITLEGLSSLESARAIWNPCTNVLRLVDHHHLPRSAKSYATCPTCGPYALTEWDLASP
jgi:hypothetical protein